MEIFGWIMLALLAAFGFGILIVFVIPFIVTEFKAMGYKIKRAIQDKKEDIDKRSEARKHRDEIKRQRDFELADKKLDAKLLKVDKQIELHNKKLKLANELKDATKSRKEILRKENAPKQIEESVYVVPEEDEASEINNIEE